MSTPPRRRHATCPACGFEDSGALEWFDPGSDVTECECDACGATIKVTRTVSVSYNAELVEAP